ncbi:MAG: Gfo/Idh/MocA family oxidoreductase [Elusimicrobiota bacterium]
MKKILIVGGGGIGERHIRCFIATKKAVVYVCEPNPSRLEQLKQKYAVKNVYTDFRKVDLRQFDGILLATPPNYHIPMATRCAEEGIPFLLEKPLSLDFNGVDKLKSIVHRKRLPCGVAYVRRSQMSYKTLRKYALSGKIGELKMARTNFSQDYTKYRPDYQRIYYAYENMGGGCILDAASHIVNLIEWILGSPKQVTAMYDKMVLRKVECEDTVALLIRFTKNSAVADIFQNQFQKPFAADVEIVGTKGNLLFHATKTTHTILYSNTDDSKWHVLKHFNVTADEPFIAQANDFIAAIDGKRAFPTSLSDAESTLRVCLAAKSSQRSGKFVNL